MGTITWLHLSDLHFKSGAAFNDFNRNIVLDTLWRDISAQMSKGIKPDFIVLSGDIAYHGLKQEYDVAWEYFFEPLMKTTKLHREKIFVVPGNHDINRQKIDSFTEGGMLSLLDDRNKINQFLSKDQDRSLAFRKFHDYAEFVNSSFDNKLNFTDRTYFYTRIIEVQGYRIAILGINSAWMSGCNKDRKGAVSDRGYLLIGEMQLEEALKNIQESDLRIAVLHHPTDWLHEIDRFNIEKRLEAECDFILHGHWHIPQVNCKQSMAGKTVYIPCGAVYASREYPNAYNLVQLNMNSKLLKIFLRRYNDKGSEGAEWTKDIWSTGEDRDGVFLLDLDFVKKSTSSFGNFSNKILFVEDKREWQEAIQSLLIPQEFEVQIASSYKNAMQALKQKAFDLIILNLCLKNDSDFDGEVILDYLSEQVNPIPSIVLTGSGGPMLGLIDRYKVCQFFVKGKGFNNAQFIKEVKRCIQKKNSFSSDSKEPPSSLGEEIKDLTSENNDRISMSIVDSSNAEISHEMNGVVQEFLPDSYKPTTKKEGFTMIIELLTVTTVTVGVKYLFDRLAKMTDHRLDKKWGKIEEKKTEIEQSLQTVKSEQDVEAVKSLMNETLQLLPSDIEVDSMSAFAEWVEEQLSADFDNLLELSKLVDKVLVERRKVEENKLKRNKILQMDATLRTHIDEFNQKLDMGTVNLSDKQALYQSIISALNFVTQ